jgi:gamma-glutamylaminecyclotransferase
MAKLFALGTLKRGFALSHALEGSRYLGPHRSVDRSPLVIAGPWYAPMLLNVPGVGRHILGELYALDEAMLDSIDKLGSVGKPGHLRIVLSVAPLPDGGNAWLSPMRRRRSSRLPCIVGISPTIRTGVSFLPGSAAADWNCRMRPMVFGAAVAGP